MLFSGASSLSRTGSLLLVSPYEWGILSPDVEWGDKVGKEEHNFSKSVGKHKGWKEDLVAKNSTGYLVESVLKVAKGSSLQYAKATTRW